MSVLCVQEGIFEKFLTFSEMPHRTFSSVIKILCEKALQDKYCGVLNLVS